MKLASVAVGFASLVCLTAFFGCHQQAASTNVVVTKDEGPQEMSEGARLANAVAESPAADGARLWEQNCMRCHNLRQPLERSDREWDIFVHHMRVRANLTAEEHRLITAFLKSAN